MEDIIVVYKEKNVGSKNNRGFILSSKTQLWGFFFLQAVNVS